MSPCQDSVGAKDNAPHNFGIRQTEKDKVRGFGDRVCRGNFPSTKRDQMLDWFAVPVTHDRQGKALLDQVLGHTVAHQPGPYETHPHLHGHRILPE